MRVGLDDGDDDDDDTVLARVFTDEAASRLVNSEEVNPETRPPNRMTGAPKLICRAQVPIEWDFHYLVT